MSVPSSGSLQETPIHEVVLDLMRTRQTGVLEVISGKVKKQLVFNAGRPVAIHSNAMSESLGRLLETIGRVTAEQSAQLRDEAKEQRRTYESLLVERRLVSAEELAGLQNRLNLFRLVGLYLWTEGTFRFGQQAVSEGADLPLGAAIAQATRKRAEAGGLLKQLEPRRRERLRAVSAPPVSFEELGLSENARQVYQAMDGSRELGEILLFGGLSPDEASVLIYACTLAGLIEDAASPAASPAQPAKPGAPAAAGSPAALSAGGIAIAPPSGGIAPPVMAGAQAVIAAPATGTAKSASGTSKAEPVIVAPMGGQTEPAHPGVPAASKSEPVIVAQPASKSEPVVVAQPASKSEPVIVAMPVAAKSEPVIVAQPVAAKSEPVIVAMPVGAKSEPVIVAQPVAAKSEPLIVAMPVGAKSEPLIVAQPVAAKSEPLIVAMPVASAALNGKAHEEPPREESANTVTMGASELSGAGRYVMGRNAVDQPAANTSIAGLSIDDMIAEEIGEIDGSIQMVSRKVEQDPILDFNMSGFTSQQRDIGNRFKEDYVRMHQQNYFELFGLDRRAKAADIRKAYFQLAKEYHTDRLVSLPEAVQKLGNEMFNLIQKAYDTLTDPDLREKYVAATFYGRANEEEQAIEEVQIVLQADQHYKTGMGLLNQGNLSGAHAAFTRARDLYPKEAEYNACYGFTLFRLSYPSNQEKADEGEKLILDAVRINPKLDRANVFLGRIYLLKGNTDQAAKYFVRALKINPTNLEAGRELQSLKSRRETEDTGLLGSLFGRFKK